MSMKKSIYERVITDTIESLKQSPESIHHTVSQVTKAIGEMTKDELALISAYVRADFQTLAKRYSDSENDPFYQLLKGSIWHGMLDITDRTQLEWQELFEDLEHQGVYQAGEMIGLGILVCETCGHHREYTHPTEITPCEECAGTTFSRQALEP